jgi:hypothetical protein
MLIDRSCRLRAAVAIRDVEIERGNAMLAEGAFESGPAVHRFGSVMSHVFHCSPPAGLGCGQEVCTLRAETLPGLEQL